MKQKKQEKYKQLLITHYKFRPCDFYEEDTKIYLNSKDNTGINVRDVYEECVIESLSYGK